MIIKWFLRMLVAAAIVAMPPQAAVAQAPTGMIPGGSYLDSCKSITFDSATNILDADCEVNERGAFEGMPVRAAGGFNVTGCIPNSIFNDDGDLYCFTDKPWGSGHVIPKGSYLASCTNSHVTNNVLIAQCAMPNDEAVAAELSLGQCRWGGDISNYHGSLTCEKAEGSLVAPVLVKPVAIEPGVVKPVSIAPLPSPAGGATEPTSAAEPRKRERKRRRDRGERG